MGSFKKYFSKYWLEMCWPVARMSGSVIITASVIMYSFSFSAEAQERLIYASPLPQKEYGARYAREFAEQVNMATGGAVEILMRQNGVLGLKGPETLAATRDGLVHIADMQMSQQVGDDSIFGIESLPCLVRSFEELRRLRSLTRPHFEKAARQFNQKILFMYPMPPQNLFMNQKIGISAAALKGLRIRTIDKNGTELFFRLGAAPIQMPWSEVMPALSSGLLDGVSTSSTTAVSGAFWDFLTHATELHWQMNSFMASVNLDAWARVPAQYHPAIEKIGKNIEDKLWDAALKADKDAKEFLLSRGIIFSKPGAELESLMKLKCDEIVTEYTQRSGVRYSTIIDGYKATVKQSQ